MTRDAFLDTLDELQAFALKRKAFYAEESEEHGIWSRVWYNLDRAREEIPE
jgi:hypothetical protein